MSSDTDVLTAAYAMLDDPRESVKNPPRANSLIRLLTREVERLRAERDRLRDGIRDIECARCQAAALLDAPDAVTGRCPACGASGTLFVAQGGYITCSRSECPEPDKVADLLCRPQYHVIQVGEHGWALEHEVTCFPNLLDCPTHRDVERWMGTIDGPPAPLGRYRVVRKGENIRLKAINDPGV